MNGRIKQQEEQCLTEYLEQESQPRQYWARWQHLFTAAESERDSANAALTNPLLYAIAWRQTAAEFRALYYQGFALAQLRVEQALAARGARRFERYASACSNHRRR